MGKILKVSIENITTRLITFVFFPSLPYICPTVHSLKLTIYVVGSFLQPVLDSICPVCTNFSKPSFIIIGPRNFNILYLMLIIMFIFVAVVSSPLITWSINCILSILRGFHMEAMPSARLFQKDLNSQLYTMSLSNQ